MDTVFLIMNGKEVHVCDYYKKEVKVVKFKDKDFWEVYDVFDLKELIEYMNYPLNYNRFKQSKVVVLYSDAKYYEMLFESKELFGLSEGLETGMLTKVLFAYCEAKEHFGKAEVYYLNYEETLYQVVIGTGETRRCSLEELEQVDEGQLEKAQKINTLELCSYLVESKTGFMPFEERMVILSPVCLEKNYLCEDKQYFLETHFIINEETMHKDETVEKGEILFQYTQYVNKMFGRKEKRKMDKKAPLSGKFFAVTPPEGQGNKWAEKGELLGVIGKVDDTTEKIQDWIRKIGF